MRAFECAPHMLHLLKSLPGHSRQVRCVFKRAAAPHPRIKSGAGSNPLPVRTGRGDWWCASRPRWPIPAIGVGNQIGSRRPVRRQSARVVSRLSLSADNPDGVPQPPSPRGAGPAADRAGAGVPAALSQGDAFGDVAACSPAGAVAVRTGRERAAPLLEPDRHDTVASILAASGQCRIL